MNPLSPKQACYQQLDPPPVGSIKTASLKKQSLASHVTELAEPMEVSLHCRTTVPCQTDLTLRQPPALPDWLILALSDFQSQAAVSKNAIAKTIGGIIGGDLKSEINTTAVQKVGDATVRHIDSFTEQVRQQFAKAGADNWQGCMEWLIRLPSKQFCCPELLALLPVELVRMRPDLPQNSLPPNNTVEQLAANSLLIQMDPVPACCEEYLCDSVNGLDILPLYLRATSALRYRFLEAVIQHAPPQSLRELLSRWLHDENCEDIAAQLTSNPLHPIMVTTEEPLLQDLLTASAERLLQPASQNPPFVQLAEADSAELDRLALCRNKVIFGRTLGGVGSAERGGNLYLKCKRLDENDEKFMAEQAMLSCLHTEAESLQLESCTVKPCGIVTGQALQTILQRLNLNTAEKISFVHAVVYNKKYLLDPEEVRNDFRRQVESTQWQSWRQEELQRWQKGDSDCEPLHFKSVDQLFGFLVRLPFPPEKREAFIDDLLPDLDRSVRFDIVAQRPLTLNDDLRWKLLEACLPAGTLRQPVTVSLFSTPAGANYHQYVTDREQSVAASAPLSERPQVLALRSWLRDYGRLFQKGIVGPPACNMFHVWMFDNPTAYHFLYRDNAGQRIRPGRVQNFDGESTNYPNIGMPPMTLRDGGDAFLIVPPSLTESNDSQASRLASHEEGVYRPAVVSDPKFVVDSLADAWLGSLLLLGRILRTPENGASCPWLAHYNREQNAELATLIGDMAVDLFSYSFAVDGATLHRALCEADERCLIECCAREMQVWMTDDYVDSLVGKEVPEWLYPNYKGERQGLFVYGTFHSGLRDYQEQIAQGNHAPRHHLGMPYAATPLQGIEILTKKALAEAVLLATEGPSANTS